jgi:hypothetical protein
MQTPEDADIPDILSSDAEYYDDEEYLLMTRRRQYVTKTTRRWRRLTEILFEMPVICGKRRQAKGARLSARLFTVEQAKGRFY